MKFPPILTVACPLFVSRPLLSCLPIVCLLMVGFGCGGASNGAGSKGPRKPSYPLQITCTTGMVADIVRNVAGEHAEVIQIMSGGVDPHLFKATTADIIRLRKADIDFYSGLHLEGKMADLLHQLAKRKRCVAVAEEIDPKRLLLLQGGVHDPHVWFDVALWSETIGVVARELSQHDPARALEYEANAEVYRDQLSELDADCRGKLHEIPPDRRVLITAHDAFGYFGRAYGLEVRAIQGISTESEAGVKEINNLVDFIVERGIKAVFVESSVADDNIRALVEGCASRGHRVVVGGELYSDAMGRLGTPDGTYIGMVRHNVRTIVAALK